MLRYRTMFAHAVYACLLGVAPAFAQSTLGTLLDSGARKLTPGEFNEQLAQTVVIGRTVVGGNVEVMYATNGALVGLGTHPLFTGLPFAKISGEWAPDSTGRICTSHARIGKLSVPDRCEFWFVAAGSYFVSESDSDRGALVLARNVKP